MHRRHPAGHQRGAVRHADRARDIEFPEPCPARRNRIDMRRPQHRMAVAAEIIGAVLVGDEQDEIRRAGFRTCAVKLDGRIGKEKGRAQGMLDANRAIMPSSRKCLTKSFAFERYLCRSVQLREPAINHAGGRPAPTIRRTTMVYKLAAVLQSLLKRLAGPEPISSRTPLHARTRSEGASRRRRPAAAADGSHTAIGAAPKRRIVTVSPISNDIRSSPATSGPS